jgi:gliding motility-associated-like protein
MPWPGLKIGLVIWASISVWSAKAQSQSCPIDINFAGGTLVHWQAYTGDNKNGNGPNAILTIYDSTANFPVGTIGATQIPEYNLPGANGVTVVTSQSKDAFGGFNTIPTINGHTYNYSVLVGSTTVAPSNSTDRSTGSQSNPVPNPANVAAQGGYVRGIRYNINVPPGSSTIPYTVTYAYAIVLENGTHSSFSQPSAHAIVRTSAGVMACASRDYVLATNGGMLDSAAARANGFSLSPRATPNISSNPGSVGTYLTDVWTKDWTEVTVDLSAYRGQQVSITFEADNCVPGGHFAYAYFALRDFCAGLEISGDNIVCANGIGHYAIPSLDGASYSWILPDGWSILSGSDANTISVKAGPQSGWIVGKEQNSCTDLSASFFVDLYKGAAPQATVDPVDTTLCYGSTVELHALITTGTQFTWSGPGLSTGRTSGAIPAVPFVTNFSVNPDQSSTYILTMLNDGCPVPVSDTLSVSIVPPIHVDIGNDTVVVVGEPLRFHATTDDPYKGSYQWSPSDNLSDPTSSDPIAVFGSEMNTIVYEVKATDAFGCYGTASKKVTVYRTLPDFFVPNAFTPDKGSNSLFRPVCVGMASLDYFQVFNRWGQLLFSTSQIGRGWDGRANGKPQETNAYLWIAKGTDYTGRSISKKGMVMLIR